MTVKKSENFHYSLCFEGTTNSRGEAIVLSKIKASDRLSTTEVGRNTLEYSFVDPYMQQKISAGTEVLITE